jgi:hypothetical protein
MGAGWFGKLWQKVKNVAGKVWNGIKTGIGAIAPVAGKIINTITPYVPGLAPALKIGGDIIGGMDKIINRK